MPIVNQNRLRRPAVIGGAFAAILLLAGCAEQSAVDDLRTELKETQEAARRADSKADSVGRSAEEAAAAAERAAARAEEAAAAAKKAAEMADRAHRAALRK